MLTLPEGALALARAARSVPEKSYDRIVAAVREDHEAQYGCVARAQIALVLSHYERGSPMR